MNRATSKSAKLFRRLWVFPLLAAGVGAVLLAPRVRKPPKTAVLRERSIKARVIVLEELDVVPRATGYGTTRPGRTWEAVAEVAGQVVWLSDDLRDGRLVEVGTELLRIDPAAYRLALVEFDAQLEASRVKDRATRASLAIAKRDYDFLTAERDRAQELTATGIETKEALEAAERRLLAGEAALQNLRNAMEVNVAERAVLEAQKASAELDLGRTVITAPFDLRLTEVRISQSQYASNGQLLFSADGLEVAEVEALFPIGQLRPLIAEAGQPGTAPSWRAPGALQLEADVRLRTATHTVSWKARVSRVAGTIDLQTQSLGVVVAVDSPYAKAEPGRRPPLVRNTFVEVELRGKTKPNQIVVPVSALHEGRLYVVSADSRLLIREARIHFVQGGFAVLAAGAEPGDRVVVSDLVPAIEGMLLEPQEDRRTKQRMVMEAGGKAGPG